MAWNHIGSSPILAVSITEAALAALTPASFYAVGPVGQLILLPANPALITWTQLNSVGVRPSFGMYATPLDADALCVAIQSSGNTTMAGTFFITNLFSSVPVGLGNANGNPVAGNDQAGVNNGTGITIGTANAIYDQIPTRPAALPVVGASAIPAAVSRLWLPVLSLSAVPTAGGAMTIELSWM